jgi:Fe-S-cluster-containing dehydrogenase component
VDNDPKNADARSIRSYYRSLNEWAQATGPAGSEMEFPLGADFPLPVPAEGLSRRRFMGLLSASAALALGTSCSKIDRGKIVAYTRRPEESIPGVATYYASTFQEGLTTQGVLVKTREGRPIHVEGNAEHALSLGKTSLRAIADILRLYDPDRLRGPALEGTPSNWARAGEEIGRALRQAKNESRPVLLLTDAVVSPTRRNLINDLKAALPTLHHAEWEPAASAPELLAARSLYGEALLPRLRFDRADVVLALQSDCLGSEGHSPVFIHDFSGRRRIVKSSDAMNRLWVIEGGMSLTGASADHRFQVRPSQTAALVFALARYLNETLAVPLPPGLSADKLRAFDLDVAARNLTLDGVLLKALAADLKRAGTAALVVGGSPLPPEGHIACQLLNIMLGGEGHTVDAAYAPASPDLMTLNNLQKIFEQAAQGAFSAAIFWGVNPAYAFPNADAWKSAATKIPLKVRIGLHEDETALDCHWRLPEHHWLESWGDFEPSADLLSLRQPTIGAIFDTRQGEDIVLSWLRALGTEPPGSYLEYLKARWQKEVFPSGSPVSFENFWNSALHDGVARRETKPRAPRTARPEAILQALSASASREQGAGALELELVLAPSAAVFDGRYANNGWLNELPDPVTKGTWGNPALVSVSDAERLGLEDEDLIRLSAGGAAIDVPVIIQPGQAAGVVTLGLGYGRRTGSVGQGVGVNAYSLMDAKSDSPHLRGALRIERIPGRRPVPRTQEHHRTEGRDLVRRWTLAEYGRKFAGRQGKDEEQNRVSLIPNLEFPEHKWGMAIDLSACVGCSACVIACQSENNVPVVGPEGVIKGREMQWIRIDRYYEGDPKNPSVLHQPVLCQHCDNAPCEIVCPVNATNHSPDGLNQMAYNRCVGTRYCSNNCPYKVRRFNFFDYTSMKKEPELLVFNPEVTVRPRGVMEKCSFCIQRIQDVRERTKVEGRAIRDGEIKPACAVACPAEAIVFGDLKDPQSRVAQLTNNERGYHLLEELGIKPAVTYLTAITNPVNGKGAA